MIDCRGDRGVVRVQGRMGLLNAEYNRVCKNVEENRYFFGMGTAGMFDGIR